MIFLAIYFHEKKNHFVSFSSTNLLDTHLDSPPSPQLNYIYIYNRDHCSVPLISITQLHPSCTASPKCLKKIVPVSVRHPTPSCHPLVHLSRETAAIMRPGLVCAPPAAYAGIPETRCPRLSF